ncbi:MAG: 2-amino-4-hydroxy-6-hydroxymethyldihydropteridine diphosphokinase [Sphingomonadales bacterium]|nr:2-amino-4-hydroxy-6-hydroxymethyldihydropteridine diphosphokinase [Sphingomonadales bacterium]
MSQRYLIALGSNVRHHRHGPPERVLAAALDALRDAGVTVGGVSPVMRSAPLGPSRRRYANAAALIETGLMPPDLLALLKRAERRFGRRSGGRRWTSRVLDLDVIFWSAGTWVSPGLTVPHLEFRQRAFVLQPAAAIAPRWRDPLTGLTPRHLAARLAKPKRRP